MMPAMYRERHLALLREPGCPSGLCVPVRMALLVGKRGGDVSLVAGPGKGSARRARRQRRATRLFARRGSRAGEVHAVNSGDPFGVLAAYVPFACDARAQRALAGHRPPDVPPLPEACFPQPSRTGAPQVRRPSQLPRSRPLAVAAGRHPCVVDSVEDRSGVEYHRPRRTCLRDEEPRYR
jgi:hypothetical protein